MGKAFAAVIAIIILHSVVYTVLVGDWCHWIAVALAVFLLVNLFRILPKGS